MEPRTSAARVHELGAAPDFVGEASKLSRSAEMLAMAAKSDALQSFYNSSVKGGLEVGQQAKVDKHGNLAGNESDLGRDGAFTGFKILIGRFAQECDTSNPTRALQAKGFEVKEVCTEGEFIRSLDWCDVASFISNSGATWRGCTETEFLNACTVARNNGKGFWIWSDNDPYLVHANTVLPSWFGFKVEGNTPGGKVLNMADGLQVKGGIKPGSFVPHTLTAGITKLFEGVTISHPPKSRYDTYLDMEVLAMSSDGNPVILVRDNTSLDDEQGRVILDCAFTKLYCSWDDAGTARYVVNGFVWLLALEQAALRGELCVPSSHAGRKRDSEHSGGSTASTSASSCCQP